MGTPRLPYIHVAASSETKHLPLDACAVATLGHMEERCGDFCEADPVAAERTAIIASIIHEAYVRRLKVLSMHKNPELVKRMLSLRDSLSVAWLMHFYEIDPELVAEALSAALRSGGHTVSHLPTESTSALHEAAHVCAAASELVSGVMVDEASSGIDPDEARRRLENVERVKREIAHVEHALQAIVCGEGR